MNLAQIASVLEQARIETYILDAVGEELDISQTHKRLKKIDPDFVIIITATSTFSHDASFMNRLKKANKKLKSIFCGTHVMTMPAKVLDIAGVDFIILGEPEYAVRDLILAIEKKKPLDSLKGIGFKRKGKVILTGNAPIIENLDKLPFPARHLLPKHVNYFNPLAKKAPYTTLMSSRGCPFRCKYCVANIVYGRKFRARSPKNVVDEMVECTRKFGTKEFFFRDETFTMDKKRALDICRMIRKKKLGINWICASRVNTIDREMMVAMKKAGCHMIKFGVESGSQKILNNLRKGIILKQSRNVFRWANELKIDTVAHFMLGSPGETKQTIQETIDFAKEIKPTYASFNITTPYPGTDLWREVEDKLNINDFSIYDIEKIHEKALFNKAFCKLSKKEIEEAFNRAHREFYFRPSYIIRRLLRQSSFSELSRSAKAAFHLMVYTIKNKLEKR
jgi:radical SAM superfamily enzyme YgiQ (UPF0313 family)